MPVKKIKHKWNVNPQYRLWVVERDRALEKLHTRAQLESADVMRDMLTHVLLTAKAQFHGMKSGYPMSTDWFETGLKQIFDSAATRLWNIATKLRTRSYTLAKGSEAEIIAQLSKRKIGANVTKSDLHNLHIKPSLAGGDLHARIRMYVDRLRRRITSYAQAAALNATDENDFARDVMQAFPKARRVTVPRRILKPPKMREADGDPDDADKVDISIDNIDDDQWNDMLDSYMNDYVPKTRSPEYIIDQPEVTGEDTWYAWEFERDMTNEFVQSVRDGQIDAANENGITDFVWVAVIDDRTCDSCCGDYGCVDFDGLLSSEIEKMTEGDTTTPPAHFNCRCTLAPATDDIPEQPDDGSKDFQEWLNS